jgi:hypothetical protein
MRATGELVRRYECKIGASKFKHDFMRIPSVIELNTVSQAHPDCLEDIFGRLDVAEQPRDKRLPWAAIPAKLRGGMLDGFRQRHRFIYLYAKPIKRGHKKAG